MNEEHYSFGLSRQEFRYEFVSISERKKVRKVVLITQTDNPIVFNLALLDLLDDTGLSDISETRNGDMKTVLATVGRIISDFLTKNPSNIILLQGSDSRRQRLYRIVIGRELNKISEVFEIFGVNEEIISRFEINHFYEFYLIKKKT